jgi:tetratricopeptide (TPR) repeat protein
MLGPAIILAAVLREPRPRWAVALCTLWIVALGLRSTQQIGYWRDDQTLWSHANDVTVDGMAVGLNLGASDIRIGKQFDRYADQRVAELSKAGGEKVDPDAVADDKAVAECRRTAQQWYSKSEQISRHLIDAREFDDGFVLTKAYRNLLSALMEQKRTEEAVDCGYRLLKLEPQKAVWNFHELSLDREALGYAILDTKTRNSEAAGIFQQSLNFDPSNTESQVGLALARKRLANPPRQAAVDFAMAIESGDMNRVRKVAVGSDAKFDWVHAFSDWTVAYKHYQTASAHQFGDLARFFVEDSQKMVSQMEDADETIDVDSATLTSNDRDAQPIHIVKVDGDWKVDLNTLWQDVDTTQNRERVEAKSDVYEEMARDVQAAKFKTAEDAQRELRRRIGVNSPPEYHLVNQGDATTLPSQGGSDSPTN